MDVNTNKATSDSTPETRYSKQARQTHFVYYIESFTISRQSISIKSHEGSWVLFTISRILQYRGLLYRVSGVYALMKIFGQKKNGIFPVISMGSDLSDIA